MDRLLRRQILAFAVMLVAVVLLKGQGWIATLPVAVFVIVAGRLEVARRDARSRS